jgi:pimeloyl-ACP methyl ester carboxylesterase
VGRQRLVVVWAGLAAVLAALLSVVSGLAVGAVPGSWLWAHDWVLLSGVTAGFVLVAVAVAVVQARSPGGGEQPGGPLVRVGTIRVRTVQITAAGQAVPGLGSWPTAATAARRPLDEVQTRSRWRCTGPPAWKTLPCWYLLGTQDKAIPPALQRFMAERANATIVEVPASHVSFVSQPEGATQLILQAVEATSAARP